MWIKYMNDDDTKDIEDTAERIWNEKMGDLTQMLGAAMVIGVVSGMESLMCNLKRPKGTIDKNLINKAMHGEYVSEVNDCFKGLPLNVIGSLENESILKLTHIIREELIKKITADIKGDESAVMGCINEMDEFVAVKLDIPRMILSALETSSYNKVYNNKKWTASPDVNQEHTQSPLGDKLSKYWNEPSD